MDVNQCPLILKPNDWKEGEEEERLILIIMILQHLIRTIDLSLIGCHVRPHWANGGAVIEGEMHRGRSVDSYFGVDGVVVEWEWRGSGGGGFLYLSWKSWNKVEGLISQQHLYNEDERATCN